MSTFLTFAMTWIRSHVPAGERGQDLIEYAVLSGVIAVAIAGAGFAAYEAGLTSLANGIRDCIDFNSSTACG
jgi:Flp pilus assembly pilin Flp